MLMGVGLFNIFNLLYHLFMLRVLSPVEYGHLNSLLALLMILSVPASTLQTTLTKFISSFQGRKQYHQVRGLLRHFLLWVSISACFIVSLILIGRASLSSFLQVPSMDAIILLGIILLFALVIPIPWGGLQGLQKFGLLSLHLVLNGGLKLLLGMLFVLLGLGISGAMGAIALSYFISFFLSLWMLWKGLPSRETVIQTEPGSEKDRPFPVSEVHRFFLPAGITLLCFMILTSADLILVKHFFTPIEAGYYSIAQMVGKIILFLPLPVVMVMFPKLSAIGDQRKKIPPVLKQSLLISSCLCGGATAFCFVFPSEIIRLLSGGIYIECIPLVRLFSVNMTFFSLTFVLLYYHLSTRERGFLYPLLFFTLAQIGLIILFHNTLKQVLFVAGAHAFFLFGINIYGVYVRPRKIDQYE
jgi:O-antigen/teichoic acid export membrane protein